MVLKIAGAIISATLPSDHLVHVIVALTIICVTYTFAQGRSTTRERDLHARVILITVGHVSFQDFGD
jgi:uncharacterized membrane protein YfcA